MAAGFTLYRFRINLSDVDRGVYEDLDLRIAMHPSETTEYLLTRALAYALNCGDGIDFSPGGLSDTEAPALSAPDPNGGIRLSIEVGAPSARRLHKASKASREVKVYLYRDPEPWLRELVGETIHRREEIEVRAVPPAFLKRLAARLERDNTWALVHQDGSLLLTFEDGESAESELTRHSIA